MAERTCPKCSASALRDDQRFCEKCGHRLDSSSGKAGWPIKVGIAVAVAAAIIAGVVLSGGSDNGAGDGTAQPAGTPPPTNAVPPSTTTAAPPITVAATTTISTTTQVPVPEGLVTSILEAQDATIRIDVTGTFHYPSDDEPLDLEGGGSGFIIDPSGLAITNNHVVAGASIIKVYVGEQEVPRSAQVVARSECSDLALIDIAGGGYDYFDWYDGEIRTGQKIYAAGFPLGDPEFTLTGGIVSKDQASAGLDTYWASLKHQIEHDARLNPGNSGGPLLTEDAKVVGVNYSGNESTRQEWAISVKEVLPILDELKAGWDVHSIGINGEAFYDYREDRYGIWVVSVESGTPADLVGLQPGDLITRVENMAVGDDETMANYCDILRSHAMDDVLKLQVYRGFSGEELVGRLNASPLEPRALSSGGLSEFVPDTEGLSDGYSEYVGISDDTKSIFVDIPVEWDQVDGEYSTGLGPNVAASSDLAKFFAGWGEDGNHAWDTPGVMVGATRDWSDWEYEEVTDHLLNLFGGGCTREPPEQYDDGLYVGVIEFASECSPSNAGLVVVGAAPLEDESALTVYVVMKIVSVADAEALINVLDSFYVVEGFEEGQSGAPPTTTTPAPSTTSSYSTSATEPVPTTAAPTTQPSVTTSAATTTQPSATTTTQVPSPPSTPRNLTAQVSGTSNPTITLDWDAPTTGGDGCQSFYCPQYRIEQSANGFNWTLVDDNSNYTYKSIYNGLNWGITYTFRVAAVNDGGLGPWTQASIIPSTTPGEPSGVEACRIGDTDEYQVTWSAPTSDGGSPVTSYTIIWGISSYQVPSMSQVITATNSTNIGVYSNNASGPSTLAASVYISSGSTDTCPGTSTTMASTTTTTTTQPPATTTTTTTTQPPATTTTTTTTTTTQPPATTTTTTQPPTAPSARSVIDVSMGYGHICAVLQGGTVKCWGFGEHAQLGYGDTSDRGDNPGEMGDNLPAVDLGTGKTATAITAGGMVSCALLSDGTVKCWGNNDSGTLGQGLADRGLGDDPGEMGDNLPPIDLGSGRTATVVATNGNGVCALLDDGSIKCWGSQFQTNIGRAPGEMGDNLPAVDLGTGKTATDIAVGDQFTCALLNDGTIKCWGRNNWGQLGYGHTDRVGDDPGEMGDNLPAVDLGTGRTATDISSGGNNTCALLDDSTVKCWGYNAYGEFGYGHTDSVGDDPGEMGDNLPAVDLGTGRTATDISVATWHTCALLDDSTIKCWGRNVSGQLGYGDISNRGDNPGEMGDNLPVVDLGTGKTATAISTAISGSCALLNDGTLKCWGNSGWGQLGQGSLTSKGSQPGQMGDNLPTIDLGS